MRGQKGSPKPTEASENEMRCPQPDTNADKCHVQERHTTDTAMMLVPFIPRHFWRVPQLFFITSLKGIAYACNIIPPFGRIHPSTFNEP